MARLPLMCTPRLSWTLFALCPCIVPSWVLARYQNASKGDMSSAGAWQLVMLLHKATFISQKQKWTKAHLPSDLMGFAELGLGSGHIATLERCGVKK